MKAVVFREARKMVVEDVPDPEAGSGEVVVKIKNSGICGSDLHLYQYAFVPPGTVMGHEATGTIVSVGDGVTGWKEGDRVLVKGGAACGKCERCLKYNNKFCIDPFSIGMGVNHGAYAEYVKVPTTLLVPLPDDLGMVEAALMDPLGCAHHGVARGRMQPGESALVIGAGPIGLFLVHGLKAVGVEQVILSEPVKRRAELAAELGADVVLDPTKVSVEEETKKLTGGLGPEAVFECVGLPATTVDSVHLVRRGGRVVWVGVCMEDISFNPLFWMLKNISLELVFGWESAEKVPDYLEFIRKNQGELRKGITEIISIDDVPDAFERLSNPNTEMKIMVEF
jgi:2-desacetyl-2-hydroxyethyl bacteriochlorophyllide A dehydrogenase